MAVTGRCNLIKVHGNGKHSQNNFPKCTDTTINVDVADNLRQSYEQLFIKQIPVKPRVTLHTVTKIEAHNDHNAALHRTKYVQIGKRACVQDIKI